MTTITIDKDNHDQRFDRFLRKFFKAQTHITLADIYRGIRNRQILVNNKKAKEDYRLRGGDTITIKKEFNDKPEIAKSPVRRIAPIDVNQVRSLILFEDSNWLVFNKPTGISIHPSDNENKQRSMHDLLRAYIPASTSSTFNASFGYRLDKETSGVLIAGKTYDSLQYINQIIRDRQIKKEYLAVVIGVFPKHLRIKKPLKKGFDGKFGRGKTIISTEEDEESKEAITECWLQKVVNHPELGNLSLIRVHIETGRMHQIRVHVADAGFPVLGDILYGHPRINRVLLEKVKLKNLFLHCWKYSFFDLFTENTVSFEAPVPAHFDAILGKRESIATKK